LEHLCLPFDELKTLKKFISRKAAFMRIWQAVARLSPDTSQLAATVATDKGKGKKSPAKTPRQRVRRRRKPLSKR
jgi:hypothetical protein